MSTGQRIIPWYHYWLWGRRIRFGRDAGAEKRSWWLGAWRPLTFRKLALPFEIAYNDSPDNPWADPESP